MTGPRASCRNGKTLVYPCLIRWLRGKTNHTAAIASGGGSAAARATQLPLGRSVAGIPVHVDGSLPR